MAGLFEPLAGGGAVARVDQVEISVLRGFAAQLLELIGPGEEPAGGDAEALLASVFENRSAKTPDDPALARLFPDAYGDPDQDPDEATRAASADFRRYTEADLRDRKRADARTVIGCLDSLNPGGAELRLTPEESRHWLGTLNDLRLALGTRLEITDEQDADAFAELPDTDPRKPGAMAYLWLSGLQVTLVETLMPGGNAPDGP